MTATFPFNLLMISLRTLLPSEAALLRQTAALDGAFFVRAVRCGAGEDGYGYRDAEDRSQEKSMERAGTPVRAAMAIGLSFSSKPNR